VTQPDSLAVPDGVVVLTDRLQARRPLPDVVRAAVDGGLRWVVLREKDLPRDERLALADTLRAILAPTGGRLIVAGPDPLPGAAAEPVGGDAVHLAAAGPYPPPKLRLVGRSCHGATELSRLSTEDYVTLSPVFPSRSKPGYGPALQPDGLARLIGRSRVPVLALGGVTSPEQVAACVAAGAAGVAVMNAVMCATDPAAMVARLAAAATPVGAAADAGRTR
jgi:thiamine-phosphate diphosphorylase